MQCNFGLSISFLFVVAYCLISFLYAFDVVVQQQLKFGSIIYTKGSRTIIGDHSNGWSQPGFISSLEWNIFCKEIGDFDVTCQELEEWERKRSSIMCKLGHMLHFFPTFLPMILVYWYLWTTLLSWLNVPWMTYIESSVRLLPPHGFTALNFTVHLGNQ